MSDKIILKFNAEPNKPTRANRYYSESHIRQMYGRLIDNMFDNIPLFAQVDSGTLEDARSIENAVAKLTSVEISKDYTLKASIEFLDTPKGIAYSGAYHLGSILEISPNGIGSVHNIDGKCVVASDYIVDCFSVVETVKTNQLILEV